MSTPLTLYYCPGSCSLASHILLTHLTIPFTAVPVSVKAGFPQSLKTLNPKSRVPVLVLPDQTVITETAAVMTAIAQLAPNHRELLGTTPLDTVRVYEWCNYLSGTLHTRGYGGYFRPERYVGSDPGMQEVVRARAGDVITECYRYIEDTLQTRKGEWAVGGESMTIVDPFLYVFWRWGVGCGFIAQGRYPRYQALVARVAALEATKKVLEIEKQEARVFVSDEKEVAEAVQTGFI